MLKLTKFRVVEIGVALMLTLAALLIFGFRMWAEASPAAPGETPYATIEPRRLLPAGMAD